MALRKALVLVGGEIQQLQPGDTLDTAADVVVLTNSDAAAAAIGEIFYIFGSNSVKKARADAAATAQAAVFAAAVITAGATGAFQSDGIIAGLSGLTPGAVYYVSAVTAGAITTTPPSTVGQFVVRLGHALSATEFLIRIERFILL